MKTASPQRHLFNTVNIALLGAVATALVLWLAIRPGTLATGTDYREVKWSDLRTNTTGILPAPRHKGPFTSPGPDPWSTPAAADNNSGQDAATAKSGRADLDGHKISLAGYVIPLEDYPDRAIAEFLLVPFAGACIHVPPPPPDQIVYVKFPRGVRIENIYQAYKVRGTLHRQMSHANLADSGYTLAADAVIAFGFDQP